MGSLVPGWDAAPGVPKGFQEEEPQQHQQGYFARLEASKSLKRTSAGGPPPPLSSLSSVRTTTSSTMMMMGRTSAPHPAHLSSSSTPHKSPKATATDWEVEIKSLGGDKYLARRSVDHQATLTDSGRSSAEQQAHLSPTWWSQFDSGALNRGAAEAAAEAAVAATRPQDLRGSFKLDVPTATNLH